MIKQKFQKSFFILCFVLAASLMVAQPPNDECFAAIHLGNISQFCTDVDQYSNIDATPSAQALPSCWPTANHDVWFTFTPTAPGVFFQLLGKQVFTDNNFLQPSMAVYEGTCGSLNLIACGSILSGTNTVELTEVDLVIGQTYIIRIDARNDNVGNFQLCIESFIPVPSPEADCQDAVTLCNTDPFFIENLAGTGDIVDDVGNSCIQAEFASVWYNWTCDQSGTLTFTLTPNNETDDIDFAVYRLPNGIDDCSNKELLRCMATGETIMPGTAAQTPCAGLTGLSSSSTDFEEFPGCSPGDDNFVAALDMISGESYTLIINNFSESGSGFSIEFGGTGTFLGPEADFEILALDEFECDKTIQFTNLSSSQTDQIVEWTWNFGAGATPVFATGEGPHDVVYDSFGDKLAALTIESSRGCTVTKIIDFFVEACCADTSTLSVTAVAEDLICFDIPDGSITAMGQSGSPVYQYSLDGVNFQPSPVFSNLDAGVYEVFIQDRKGCISSVMIEVLAPPPLIVDAGPDQETIFGCMVDFNASYTPNVSVDISWSPNQNFSCDDCLDPTVLPTQTQVYEITIFDEAGCRASDDVLVTVDDQRPFYAPNIFSPNNDGHNEFFTVFPGKAAVIITELYVFDRWGNRIFFKENVPLNDPPSGWDGKFKNEELNPGVYSWLAKVLYIDDQVIDYYGDITLLR